MTFQKKQKVTDEMLTQLRNAIKNRNHTRKVSSLELWYDLGRPYCWELKESKLGFKAVIDFSYGCIALFENNKLVSVGTSIVATKDCSLIKPDDISAKNNKYLWF